MERLRAVWARLPGLVQTLLTLVLVVAVMVVALALLRAIAPG